MPPHPNVGSSLRAAFTRGWLLMVRKPPLQHRQQLHCTQTQSLTAPTRVPHSKRAPSPHLHSRTCTAPLVRSPVNPRQARRDGVGLGVQRHVAPGQARHAALDVQRKHVPHVCKHRRTASEITCHGAAAQLTNTGGHVAQCMTTTITTTTTTTTHPRPWWAPPPTSPAAPPWWCSWTPPPVRRSLHHDDDDDDDVDTTEHVLSVCR